MCCKFLFIFKLNESNKQSRFFTNEEEYRVSIMINRQSFDLEATVEWNKCANIVIIAKIYSDLKKVLFSANDIVVNSNKSKINFANYRNYIGISNKTYMCMMNIIPLALSETLSYWENINDIDARININKGRKQPINVSKIKQLSEDMKSVLDNRELSDLTLKFGDNEVRAHKVVLASRSPIFAKLFKTLKEDVPLNVTITNISPEVMKEFLTFIYTGTATIQDMKMAHDLYVIADKYGIKDLREECSTFLKDVNLDTVFDTLVLSTECKDESLKLSALKFISKNYSQIKKHSNWDKFLKENNELAFEIFNFVIENK